MRIKNGLCSRTGHKLNKIYIICQKIIKFLVLIINLLFNYIYNIDIILKISIYYIKNFIKILKKCIYTHSRLITSKRYAYSFVFNVAFNYFKSVFVFLYVLVLYFYLNFLQYVRAYKLHVFVSFFF